MPTVSLQFALSIADEVVEQAHRVLEVERSYFDFLASEEYSYAGLKKRMGREE